MAPTIFLTSPMTREGGDVCPSVTDGIGAGRAASALLRSGTGMRLRGRTSELASLVDLLSRAETSGGGVAFVEGEGGIGKTRLLAEVLAAARRQGFHVFSGRGEQLERMRPFGPLVQAFGCTRTSPDPRLADIARLVSPGPDDAGGLALAGTLEYRAAEAFVDLVEHRCADGPLALVLEDLHWADDATLVAIRVLARRVTVLPLVILATLRPVPTTPELVRLVEACVEEGGLHLRLGALAADPVHELVAEALGAPPGPRLRQQLAGAAGNPLFVTELARALVQEKQISMVAGHAEVDRVQASPTLRLTILRRLGALSPPTLELLRLAAVLGPSFSPSELATVLGRSVAALMPALDEALGAGVLGEAGARLCFRHDLVHEALYGELPRAVREGLHRDVARALTAAGASALQVAQHLLLGAAPGDAQAVVSLRAAAGEAASRSPAMAAELLGRAVELTEASTPSRDLVLAERVVDLEEAGAALAASDAFGASVAVAPAHARLGSSGGRRAERGRRPRPRQGWESLTVSEQRVVALVAQGLTNIQVAEALFVSRHTVESHVSHVFAKLGLTSRTELAARAVARSTGPS